MGSYLAGTPTRTATADYPELCIEWLPTLGPGAEDGAWCDITTFVTSGDVTRGRRYETDRFAAGTLTLELKVDPHLAPGRLFDPEWTTGPFYPYLVPMRQIRISAVWNGTYYPVFRGYITDWGQTVLADRVFVTNITARDAFVVLEQKKLLSSAYAMEVAKDTPSAWFRLNETGTTLMSDSSGNGYYGRYENCTQGANGLTPGDEDRAVTFVNATKQRISIPQPDLITAYPFTIECLVRVDPGASTAIHIIFTGAPLSSSVVNSIQFYLTVGGFLVFRVQDGSGNWRRLDTNQRYDDNAVHHLAAVATDASTFTVYVDGAVSSAATTTSGTGAPSFPSGIRLWGVGNYASDVTATNTGFGGTNPGTIDELAIWPSALTPTAIAAHSLAGATGWAGDDSGARVTRFLDLIDYSPILREIDAGASTLGVASWSDGATALNALQAWADTELGAFFVGKDGRIVWHSRHYPFLDPAATTSQATFGDANSSATITYQSVELPRDETLIRNPVQAARRSGITAVAHDDPGIQKYGDRQWSAPTSEDATDPAMQDRAEWLLARYKELGSRLAELRFMPRADPANLWPQVLGREFGDRVTIKRTPLGSGNEIVVDQILEGVAHRFAPKQWETVFTGSPADPNVGAYLILDDANYGLLDNAELGY